VHERVTVIGGTGAVGRRMVPELVAAGAIVTVASRHPPPRVLGQPGSDPPVRYVRCDLENGTGLDAALGGADLSYFLAHGMAGSADFALRERASTENFIAAAGRQGVRRVIYLGGLYPEDVPLSPHLESRREVGLRLIDGVGALAVRAGVLVGVGSASFEILLGLCRHLPVMIAPRWLGGRSQPIGIDDAVRALVGAGGVPGGREVDLAGPDVLTYRRMLELTALEMRGRAPFMIPVPVLTPELSAHWLQLVTRVDIRVARALVASLRHDTVAARPLLAAELGFVPAGFRESVERVLHERDGGRRPA
jgi:uncharacterized protein YbjT (DUF2867 family)